MENKLELKHLAAYLPFGLKVRSFREGQALFLEDISMSGEFIDYLFKKSEVRTYSTLIYKPILRPLSDLTKEITHNGETFVPLAKYNDVFGENDDYLIEYLNDEGGIDYEDCKTLPQYVFNWLASLHFDLYDLIEKGLAIDINTI